MTEAQLQSLEVTYKQIWVWPQVTLGGDSPPLRSRTPPPPCGRVKMALFVLLACFPLLYSNFWPNLRPIHVARPLVVLWCCDAFFPFFIGISGGFGVLEPRLHHLYFSGLKMPFQAPKTLRFKRENRQFRSEKYYKIGERNAKRTNGSIFTHVPPPPPVAIVGEGVYRWGGQCGPIW